MKRTILLACLTSTLSTGLIADDYPDFEAYLGAGRYHFDDERRLDDANSLELGAEVSMAEALSLEAWFTSFDAGVENSPDELEGTRYTLGGLYHFSNQSLRPFISLGLGHQELEDNSNDSHTEALAYLGAGVKKYFDSNIILRGELLGLKSFDHEFTDLGARIAVGYAFGRNMTKPAPMSELAPVQRSVQSSPANVNKAAIETSRSQPVLTSSEQEADKPAAKFIAKAGSSEGAFIDSDQDGVTDNIDQCEGTDKVFKVDKAGCPIMLTETVSIKMNVKFPSNSAIVSEANFSEIRKVADFMKQFAQTTVTVEGHSDDSGRATYNKSLSQKRADAVRATLINHFKLAAQRVNAVGYGEETPIADNSTAAGRAENRRVVAVVKSNIQKEAVK